jgi:ferric-dicitrate binding protein FerR (iron transport regulator)
MESHRKDSKNALEAALNVVRGSEPDRQEMETGAARVWARIGQELDASQSGTKGGVSSFSDQIRNCEDYRALIPDYIAGHLSSARAILFKDHTHECVSCRNALNAAVAIGKPSFVPRRPERRFNRAAAVVAVAAALVAAVVLERTGYLDFVFPVVEVHAMARTIDGQMYRIEGLATNPITAGDKLNAGVPVRTGAGSRAVVELADGTRIEMRERSQLSLVGARDGVRINLERGSVIVEAAKQRDGHLYVATDDCSISVVGTVFAVSTGIKGSRVSVLEGEVRVKESASPEKALFPGQQATTTPSLTAVSIEDEISWSQNLSTHLALLRALADVNNFLRDRIPGPQLRFNSALLQLVPANTVVYGAFPNLSSTLGQAYDLFRQRIDGDPLLRTWWATKNTRREPTSLTLEEMVAHVRSLGGQLGQEVVLAVTGSPSGPGDVIVLANVQNASGAVAEITTILAGSAGQNPVRVLTDPTQLAQFTTTDRGPIAYVGGSILVLASSPQAIYNVVTAQQSGSSPFASRPFYASIAQAYSKGAGTLFAADLATLFSEAQRSQEAQSMGLTRIDGLVVEQKQVSGKTMTRAQLSFNGERAGVGAWLAPPAPMGALEFVSPQAYGVASIVTKDALVILDEILTLGVPGGQTELDQFQRTFGVDLRRDLAQPLGGEFLFAMDGPFLPTPSWKIVAEVYDSARLQNTIELLVRETASLAGVGIPSLSLSSESSGGQVYYRLRRSDGQGPETNYTYALGYMIAAPSRALVSQALQYQQSRSSIADSAKFRAMMPIDDQDHCSAILYQNLTETVASIANYVPSGVGGLSSEQLQTLRQTVELTPPTLVCAAGEPNRIVMGYQGDLAFNVLMLGGLQRLMSTVGGAR